MDVIRDRNRLYHETGEGLIENVYTLKLLNMDDAAHTYKLNVTGIDGMKMLSASDTFDIKSGEIIDVPVRLQVDPYDIHKRSSEVTFSLQSIDNPELTVTEPARFLGPVRGTRQ
jgi:polyferredoxin